MPDPHHWNLLTVLIGVLKHPAEHPIVRPLLIRALEAAAMALVMLWSAAKMQEVQIDHLRADIALMRVQIEQQRQEQREEGQRAIARLERVEEKLYQLRENGRQ